MDPNITIPDIRIDRKATLPLYRQVRDAILDSIRSGRIPAGSRLPPTRVLAKRLGLNRTTICAAYRALESEGFVLSHVGRGTMVADALSPGRVEDSWGPQPPADWSGFSQGVRNLLGGMRETYGEVTEPTGGEEEIDFSRLLPDERLFPVRQFRTVVNRILSREGAALLQYGPASGYSPMREILAERLDRRGLPTRADQILIVSGAQQGMDLVFRMFLDPGDAVVVESPTYSHALPLLRFHRARIVSVPMTPEGMNLDTLGSVVSAVGPKMIYTMPSLHNPTGVTTSEGHRRKLLTLASRYRVPILEDGFEEELPPRGKRMVPLKALDSDGMVIHLGTFSKGLFPGLRIGWLLAARQFIRVAAGIKSCSDYHTSLLSQAAVAEFCRQGHYDAHLEKIQRIFRRRLRVALKGMRAEFPREIRWNQPDGGYCIWIELPPGVSSDELRKESGARGVRIAPGQSFFDGDAGRRFFRISISRVDEEEIRAGVERLGEALRELLARRREDPPPAVRKEAIPYF